MIVALFPASIPAVDGLFFRGDVDQTRAVDVSDAVSVFNWLFLGAAQPPCLDAVDSNDDGAHDLTDGIYILNWLFLGGSIPPAPSPDGPCPGSDPTADVIGCEQGLDGGGTGEELPVAELFATLAPPRGVRQRSRERIETDAEGRVVVQEGQPFALLFEARRNAVSRAPFSLVSEATGLGDPASVDVRCDRDLGDPDSGGIAAGENLARLFAAEIDPWSDRIYLLDHLTLRVDGEDAWSPAAGEYLFTASVTDESCESSSTSELRVLVQSSTEPVLRLWIERGPEPDGTPLQHDEGSGGARLADDVGAGPDAQWLVVDVAANPRGGPAPDFETLTLVVDPPSPGGADWSDQLLAVDGASGRFAVRLTGDTYPSVGNTRVEAGVAAVSGEGAPSTSSLTLEVPVGYVASIQLIWNQRCTGCHEHPNNYRGLEIVGIDAEEARRNIVNRFAAEPVLDSIAERLVRPYLPERSYLWRKLTATHNDPEVGGEGTRMPQGEEPLSAERLHVIESWILQGAD